LGDGRRAQQLSSKNPAPEGKVPMLTLIGIAILWVVPCYICWQQGKAKNRLGLAWGVCLGWLGVLALAVLPAASPSR